ncbi:DUF2288 domain-containing protein [Halochromatium roseum]|uniref:DUF2288 domain-containing protein n=1 Tax=Halochromatium roseum TaxID=391920 RepID=UPI0019144256|nr:DUF2288 domain-containing protein [Halochromatium roseum]MBK5939455.1 hypothetical protein [Halochromatium roseum]
MQPDPSDVTALTKAKLGGETAKIPWCELQRFFAQGRAIHVATGLDLVEVALAVHHDDAEQVLHWMTQGQVERVRDADARHWIEVDALVWALVVRPWVLVQPLELDEAGAD